MRRVHFVRVLRVEGMKYGVAVDKAGKRWRGFSSSRKAEDIRRDAVLGSVGVCMVCLTRVFSGWECLNDARDVCNDCVRLPPRERVTVVPATTQSEWDELVRRFYRGP